MLKKNITYTNPFTDVEVTEGHYFHISKADLVEMEMEEHNRVYKAKDGQDYTGMQAKLKKIIDSEDGKAILAELKDIVRRSYGQKVGDRFLKSPDATQEFMSSEAFSQLLFELCTDAEKAAEFTNGIIPSNLAAEAASIARQSADISDAEEQQAASVTPLHDVSQGASASPAIEAVERVADETGADFPKADPQVITEAEAREMTSEDLKNKLMSGKYTLATDL